MREGKQLAPEETPQHCPAWDDLLTPQPHEVVGAIVEEGVHRLLCQPLTAQDRQLYAYLTAHLGPKATMAISDYWDYVVRDAVNIATKLTYALAVNGIPDYFESLLHKAIETAGLTDYQCEIELELPD